MSKEKERAPRFRIEQAITLELTRERFIQAEGLNLSESGLLMVTDSDVEPMTNIYLMLTVSPVEDRNHQIICEGYIARVEKASDGYHLGIHFSSMEDEDKLVLNEYLAVLAAKQG